MVTLNDVQQSRSLNCNRTAASGTDDAVAPNPKLKRPRRCLTTDPTNADANRLNALLESFLEFHDSSAIALDLALGRILESKPHDPDKNDVIDRALELGSAITEAAKRCGRRRATMHNAVVWALPSELTAVIFSMLDTQSVCHAAAACSFFNKCAADPVCYSNINLTTTVPRVNNLVVSTMIQRAGKKLRSLKLGTVPCPPVAAVGSSQAFGYSVRNSSDTSRGNDKRSRQGKETFILTRSCLTPLIADGGSAPGALLKRLHLYNIESMDNTAFRAAISACPSLVDLEIIGLHVELRQTLKSVSRFCPLIERLFFESSTPGIESLELTICNNLVNNLPCLSSLALRGFGLTDHDVRVLVKGLRNLKYVDFSKSIMMTGDFLRDIGVGGEGGSLLEVLILRDCRHLLESEVSRLLSAIHTGGCFNLLTHLDVSNREGLASDNWRQRCYTLSFTSLHELLEERPNLRVVADFPAEECLVDERRLSSDVGMDTNSPSSTSSYSHTSEGYSSWDNSDQSSDNDNDWHGDNWDDLNYL